MTKNRMSVSILAAMLTMPLMADVRHTIYVERMGGLESFVERALQAAEASLKVVEPEKQPEWKASLSRMRSEHAEILYRQKLGRYETHRLELRDVARQKVVAWHAFELKADDESRERAVLEFADKVKKAIRKSAVDKRD